MSLAKRLNQMERRIKELEDWKQDVEQALADEMEQSLPGVSLDGEQLDPERDQTQSLG